MLSIIAHCVAGWRDRATQRKGDEIPGLVDTDNASCRTESALRYQSNDTAKIGKRRKWLI
jgi:hypothetical protein